MAKRGIDPKAKAKRQKIIVIVGAVLLVLVLVVELPGALKNMNPPRTDTLPPSYATGPTSTVVATTTGTLAPPTLAGQGTAATPVAAVAAGTLVASDVPAAASTTKLVSFSLFVSKDPFRQQVTQAGLPPDPKTGGTGTSTTPSTPNPPTPPTSPTPATPQPPQAPPTSAMISVNGTSETVTVGTTFPAAPAQPFFQLVSLTRNSATIAIAGGSLTGGQKTLRIPVGKTVTLMNTADGTKYTLKLVSVG